MAIPTITFSVSGNKISAKSGFDSISVTFSCNVQYQAFECRATKAGASYGVGIGTLVASFSTTPAGTQRTFEVYDDFLTKGDGQYRVSLYAQADDGTWSDMITWADAKALWATWSGAKAFTWGQASRGGAT